MDRTAARPLALALAAAAAATTAAFLASVLLGTFTVLGNLGLLRQIPFPDATVSVVSIANNAVPLLMFGFAAVTSLMLIFVDSDVRGVPPWALRAIGLVGLFLNGLCVAMVAVGATGNIDSPLIAYGWPAMALTPGIDFVIVGLAALAAIPKLSASSHHDSALLAPSQNEL
jgi:hypothetical protein